MSAIEVEHAKDLIVDAFAHDLEIGDRLTIEKVVAIHTSRDQAIASPALAASQAVRRAPEFAGLLASHAKAWDELWRQFEIGVVYTITRSGIWRRGASCGCTPSICCRRLRPM